MANLYLEDVESTWWMIRTVAILFDDRERGRRNELLRTQMFDGDAYGSRRKVKIICSMADSLGALVQWQRAWVSDKVNQDTLVRRWARKINFKTNDLIISMLKYRQERTKNSSRKVSSVEIKGATILYRTRILDDKVDTLHRYGKGSGKLDWNY